MLSVCGVGSRCQSSFPWLQLNSFLLYQVCEFVKTQDLTQGVITVLWERFALKLPNTTRSESHCALVLLGMAAGAEVDIVRSNIDVLVKEGLGARAEKDLILAKDTCAVLLKLAGTEKKKVGEKATEPFRLPQDHDIFQRLETLLVWGKCESGYYCLNRIDHILAHWN